MNISETPSPSTCFLKFGKFQVRSLLQSDSDSVKSLIFTVRGELQAAEYHRNDSELDNLFETYQGRKSVFLVLTFNEKIIGTVGIKPFLTNGHSGCELKKFYIKKSWRGLGLGNELIRCCLAKARELEYVDCYLETDPTLKRAGKIYDRLGFEPLARNSGLPKTKYSWQKKVLALHDFEKSFSNG